MSDHPRRQFTLSNLMMLIAVVGISLAMVTQWSYQVRFTGCGPSCQNNQRQVGLALQGYLNAHNRLPNSVTWGEPAGFSDSETILLNYENNDLAPPPGQSHPEHDVGPLYSWVVDILPYMDQQSLYNDFDRKQAWDSTKANPDGTTNNLWLSSAGIGILVCPRDDTIIPNAGNLTYVVNSGFNRWWYSKNGWNGTANPPRTDPNGRIDWGHAVGKKTGLMWPGTRKGNRPWDHQTQVSDITDGLSNTVLLTENLHAGATDPTGGNPYGDGRPTGWACGHPNFVAFMASDDVCTGPPNTFGTCRSVGDLQTTVSRSGAQQIGSGWARANAPKSPERINGQLGKGITGIKGGSPFPSSNHPGVIVVTMADGSVRNISETIEGAVWSQLITPAGQTLPASFQQPPLP